MSSYDKARTRKMENLFKAMTKCMRESLDYYTMSTGAVSSTHDVTGLLPSFASTSQRRAEQAGAYARRLAQYAFHRYPELRA